jgi:hypothetical protein
MLLTTSLADMKQIFNRANMADKCPNKLPTWSIIDRNKQRKASVLNAHVEFAPLDIVRAISGDPFIECGGGKFARENGAAKKIFIRIYDNVALPDDLTMVSIPCKFSFQQHVYGDFVIIRNNLTAEEYAELPREPIPGTGNNRGYLVHQSIELYGHKFDTSSGELL